MREIKFYLLLLFIFSLIISCSEKPQKQFTNPILAGYYPDPSICRVGDDYYLVNSTFSYFPGIPIFHSKDLVNWEIIGHALDRPEQLDLEGIRVSGGNYAPAISHHNGVFYIICTIVDGPGNYVVTSKTPEGPYSNLVLLPEINGIDPSLFFDDNDKAYIVYNSDAPENTPLYEGHRTIKMVEFDIESKKVVSESKILVNGGTDLSKKPVWIEGPHIYKQFDHYYLMAAEGGTSIEHSEVIFRSENIDGPYEPYKGNPILTQRHLDPKRQNPITSTGHADLIETQNGEWWAVFLGCRPYEPVEKNYYNLGRETFLAPVKWIKEPNSDGAMWPIINPDFEEVQYSYNYPDVEVSENVAKRQYGGNFSINYDFDNSELSKDFIFLRTPKENWFSLNEKNGYLSLNVRPESCGGSSNPSFIAHRKQHNTCTASTKLLFNPDSENEKSGLLIFMNDARHYFICKSFADGQEVIQLYKGLEKNESQKEIELINSINIPEAYLTSEVNLRINSDGKDLSFEYSFEDDKWKLLQDKVDADYIKAVIPRDFTGAVFALYSTSLGTKSNSVAHFNDFNYIGKDKVHEK